MESDKTIELLHCGIKIIKPIAVLFGLGFLYLIFFQTFEFGIPCMFNKMTGYKCPGCGMTHAMVKIWKGEFTNAFNDNALSVTLFPVICIYLLYRYIKVDIKKREGFYIWEYIFLIITFVVVIGYGYIRNQI